MDVAHQLDCEWSLLARHQAARALAAWRQAQPQLRRFHSPSELLLFLHTASAEQTDPVLLALLTLARDEQLARRTLLQVLLPALKTQAERIVSPACRRDEVWEVLLCVAWETICRYPLERRHVGVATKLVLDILHHATRELRRQTNAGVPERPHEAGLRLTDHGSEQQATRFGEHRDEAAATAEGLPAEAVLLQGVHAGVLARLEAELILLTRVDGIRLRLLARTLGVGYHALRQRRQRAERRLRAFLAANRDVSKHGVSALVSAGGTASSPTHKRAANSAISDAPAERAA